MRDLRVQYFLTYCVLGAVLPFVWVFFQQEGLTRVQIGYAGAVWSAAVVLSPVLVTLAADAHADPRRLLCLASALTAASLFALALVRGVGPVVAVWGLYCVASLPVLPLQDGVHFSEQRRRRERGEKERPFHLVRVWGTIGFILPSILLFVLLQRGLSLRSALWTGAACAALAAAQALALRDPRPQTGAGADTEAAAQRRLPTLSAARALLRPDLLVFTAAVVLLQMAGSAHFSFYPIYLTDKVGLDKKWLGPAANLAVFVEMFFVFASAALVRRVGVKGMLLLATAATALRFGLVAASSHPAVALGTQVFHGVWLVAVGVLPQIILDQNAEDRFRHSMQGVFVMLTGAGRVIASSASGYVAARGLSGLYICAAGLCVIAGVLTLIAYEDPAPTGARDGARGGTGGGPGNGGPPADADRAGVTHSAC